jgi:TatD DNase family protein
VNLTEALVDFHCHLDLYPDFETLVTECDASAIHTLAVTTTPRAWDRNNVLASKTKHVKAALGLHPQIVGTHGHEIDLWETLLPNARFVGEVGLDAGPGYFRTLDQQKSVFERILKACNREREKVLSIHSVRAATMVLDMIESHLPDKGSTVVLHWFTGSASEARRAVDLGCYFSINAQMALSAKTGKLVASLPRDRLLTETDGPFGKVDGHSSRPKDVLQSLKAIAKVRSEPLEDMMALVHENYRKLCSVF